MSLQVLRLEQVLYWLTPDYEQGAVIEDGRAKIKEYIAHRNQREEETLQALRDFKNKATSMDLVKIVYKNVPEDLHLLAANGVTQVLRKLEAEEKVAQQQGGRWQVVSKATL